MNLKEIRFPIEIKSVNHARSYILQKAYTNDLDSVKIIFELLDCTPEDLTGATASIMLYMRDGSFFQDTATITGNAVTYTLTEAQGNHSGVAQTQVIVKKTGTEWASSKEKFEIVSGLETVVATEVMIKDWTMLTAEARAFLDQAEADEALRVSAESTRLADEALRVSAESARLTAEAGRASAETLRQAGYAAMDGRIVDLEDRSLKKYGVRRVLEATSPLLERIHDGIGKVAQVPTDDGPAVNDFDSIYPWSHLRECKLKDGRVYYKGDPGYDLMVDCDWMVEIPKFYLRIAQDVTTRDIVVSQYKHPGFWCPQAFKNESGAELDKIYVGRFKTGIDGTSDVSRPAYFPENFRDLASFRTGARAKGAGWQQIDLSYVQEVLHPLYLVESATLNSQDYLGAGLTSYRYVATDTAQLAETAVNRIVVANAAAANYNVGENICIGTSQGSENIAKDLTILSKSALVDGVNTEIIFDGAPVNIALGNVLWQGAQKCGQTVSLTKPSSKLSGVSGRRSNKYRGLEDIFGNVYEWVDGVLISDLVSQVCRKPSLYASALTADYKPAGYANIDVNGYPKEMGWDENFPEARFPISVGAGTTTGYCDNYYQAMGLRGAFFGGHASHGTSAGLFFWFLHHAPTYTYWNIGSRLLFKPPV